MRRLFGYSIFFIGILFTLYLIMLPNFIGAQDRSKVSHRRIPRYTYEKELTSPSQANTKQNQPTFNTESYDTIDENPFQETMKNPVSTFALDVDTASYSNVRRFFNQNQFPPKDAIRTEELVNYFSYHYPQPTGKEPIALVTEVSECPWNPLHKLVHIGLQGKSIDTSELPPSNLVFLLDVSGSMVDENKLPLLKRSLRLMFQQLREKDTVSMVVYAGAAGLVLPPTSGADKDKLFTALDKLEAGGSTAGGAGIQLAYEIAQKNFRKGGNNRVILATDGDFNIGPANDGEMVRLIEEKRKTGIFLTVLGFGMGNYKDSKMEKLANRGNGNYAYIDNLMEAKKVLVTEFGGTLLTIAKDVKIQVEFNPMKVAEYRLIGYENRLMNHADFDNDKKDAGEMGSGHTMTALYEITETAAADTMKKSPPFKYQTTMISRAARHSQELLTLKLRYKRPHEETSNVMIMPVLDRPIPLAQTTDDFRFAAAVAGFGLLLRDSEYKGTLSFDQIKLLAQNATGQDDHGYGQEFLRLVDEAKVLKKSVS